MSDVYFVASSSDEPEAIYFDEEEAFASGFEFLDVFDEEGIKVLTYKLATENEHTCEDDYTTKF
jgi:hypothetical protein